MTFGFAYFIAGLFPLAFRIAFSGLEIAIAFIQSIVFVILTSSYLKDGLELHTPEQTTLILNSRNSNTQKKFAAAVNVIEINKEILKAFHCCGY